MEKSDWKDFLVFFVVIVGMIFLSPKGIENG